MMELYCQETVELQPRDKGAAVELHEAETEFCNEAEVG